MTYISLEEFHARYAHQHGYEYWFGVVVSKTAPTWLHAILQSLLAELFYEQGYFSGSELDLRISRDFQPRPDVAASLHLESTGYPTKPIDIVAEILSPGDSADKVLEKCRHYEALGILRSTFSIPLSVLPQAGMPLSDNWSKSAN